MRSRDRIERMNELYLNNTKLAVQILTEELKTNKKSKKELLSYLMLREATLRINDDKEYKKILSLGKKHDKTFDIDSCVMNELESKGMTEDLNYEIAMYLKMYRIPTSVERFIKKIVHEHYKRRETKQTDERVYDER